MLISTVIISAFCLQRISAANAEKRAFDLAQIEARFEGQQQAETEERGLSLSPTAPGEAARHRDDVSPDVRCQAECDRRLHSGLDMVKAHNAFGSLGLPSLIDEADLRFFCHLDNEHSQCLARCGFTVTFNMRDYVCKERTNEMVAVLPCYARAAGSLKRRCGSQRCGPYEEDEPGTEHRSAGSYGRKCNVMTCDLHCSREMLIGECGRENGIRSAQFLLDYSRLQVKQWMLDLADDLKQSISTVVPSTCLRIFCDRFTTENCTLQAMFASHRRRRVRVSV